ncbi:uncharacterized protein LOC122940978 [Bufo gargarizans]|uniref:uncharacterized protein LOC122940978 n=1 Tax=Bufo gargarizans TaxID=30331 RepID=UPI001CF4FCC7|nr:uncharacterized protein LOC122940978 [Bufo gargarizans]XP_044153866.1 uncharacterized protein LOC122940978 [Bufo gargarizans]XP_044153867.1 uncharacterized protein LOC122940978 [Bufo gargarizans]XP_044153868.1 uncharacterized protein LOC122940978 [Bufo gargarizans]XP_044153869.1 uncharacterized protein LOC122940978 [Bufo gargarizans]XP_044153870.1 uncharacterized protein LOC122940978 [Bufo gargarizans]XP_044153871.1 uncharacterized protein LOC122940978 [Bufo gargarizans]XP_044153872.1 unc
MNSAPSSLGLLSGYNSSSSDDEDEAADNTFCRAPSKSSFFADATSSSEEEANTNNKDKAEEPPASHLSPLPSFRLPAPCLSNQSGLSSSSVFSNPFQDEKQAQLSILERHVKLSDGNWARGGKGVCLAYQRDGRCRYGTKCKYSHSSDLPQGSTAFSQRPIVVNNSSNKVLEMQSLASGEEQVEEPQSDKGKRKKPGLSDTLVPPKRSLKNYQKQLSTDRPWTV